MGLKLKASNSKIEVKDDYKTWCALEGLLRITEAGIAPNTGVYIYLNAIKKEVTSDFIELFGSDFNGKVSSIATGRMDVGDCKGYIGYLTTRVSITKDASGLVRLDVEGTPQKDKGLKAMLNILLREIAVSDAIVFDFRRETGLLLKIVTDGLNKLLPDYNALSYKFSMMDGKPMVTVYSVEDIWVLELKLNRDSKLFNIIENLFISLEIYYGSVNSLTWYVKGDYVHSCCLPSREKNEKDLYVGITNW